MEEKTVIELQENEKKVIQEYQRAIEGAKSNLGNLRRQYLASENRLIGVMTQAENDFVSHIKKVADSLGLKTDSEDWVFDPNTYTFRKREA